MRYANRALTVKELEGTEMAGRGPLIIALDSSGSMGYDNAKKEVWSKAATMVLLAIAKEEKRDVRLIHFSSGSDLREKEFPAGEGTIEEITTEMEFFFAGGTEYQSWINRVFYVYFVRLRIAWIAPGSTTEPAPMRQPWIIAPGPTITPSSMMRSLSGNRCRTVFSRICTSLPMRTGPWESPMILTPAPMIVRSPTTTSPVISAVGNSDRRRGDGRHDACDTRTAGP